ncbi:Armadillo repeat-containing protein 12 [Galemys pyrenaicus]|uniref:Armadillo repeat-containing protein 12 n=1 Tax=Galemys pyrenaicus TaxID=202257 RepID=A0A8J5ZY92_GALPY|nr:Armadillo repeat-containing protein 12 [Galemys pyrenaicus]
MGPSQGRAATSQTPVACGPGTQTQPLVFEFSARSVQRGIGHRHLRPQPWDSDSALGFGIQGQISAMKQDFFPGARVNSSNRAHPPRDNWGCLPAAGLIVGSTTFKRTENGFRAIWPLPGASGLAPTQAQGGTEDMGVNVPQCVKQLDIRKTIVSLATGAGAIYLLYKAIRAGVRCQPPLCTNSPICIARLAIERERHGRDSGELRRLLNSLECKQDEFAKSMILHSITRCVYLLEAEEHSIKVLELISTIWDSELHIAGLRLLNSLPLPDFVHPQLRRVMPALMEILQSDYILAQVYILAQRLRTLAQTLPPTRRGVQAIRLLSYLAQKHDLLYDILNCQVHDNFLNLFQATQSGSLLFEVLVFAERLSEGRNSPHYRAVKWHYNEQSLHEALFGDESRLADRLLALVIHPEEEVQIQACKVIVSLQCPPDVGCRPTSCHPSHSYFNNGE